MARERFQNPVVGDSVNLRLYVWNANTPANFNTVNRVDIYYIDQTSITDDNPDGRILVESFGTSNIVLEETGSYSLIVTLTSPKYVIGKYVDVWTVSVNDTDPEQTIQQCFEIFPQLWYTAPGPILYDFSFLFRPNKIRQGSIVPILIEVKPNVPTASDLQLYYQNLAIVSDLRITIEQMCGDCLPEEEDLRIVVDKALVQTREKRMGYYKLDTTDLDCGIYHVTFQLELGENVYISEKFPLQIFN